MKINSKYTYICLFGVIILMCNAQDGIGLGVFNRPSEEWVQKNALFDKAKFNQIEKSKKDTRITLRKLYPRSLSQYLADLYCEKNKHGHKFRCHDDPQNCYCIKSSLSFNSFGKSCLYENDLVECLGTKYQHKDYTLEQFDLFNDKNVCPVKEIWKEQYKQIDKETELKEFSDTNIKEYQDTKPRGLEKKVSEILEKYGAHPVKDMYSDLYYYNDKSKEDEQPDNFDLFEILENLTYFKTFEHRHGVEVVEICIEKLNICNIKNEYLPCISVKRRYYVNTDVEFYLDYEEFSLSNMFSVYLEEKENECGKKDIEDGEVIKFLQVPIYQEITFPPRRMIHLGPFDPIKEAKVLKICACSTYRSVEKQFSCVKKEDYGIEIGELVVREKKQVHFEQVNLNQEIKLNLEGHQNYTETSCFMIESEIIDGDCTTLFELYKVNWEEGKIEELPRLRDHFIWGKLEERELVFLPKGAGKYCICKVDIEDAKVETHETGYTIKGIIKTVKMIAYIDGESKTHVDSIMVELVGLDKEEIDFVAVVDSQQSCGGQVIGKWVGERYRYSHPLEMNERKYLILTEFSFEKDCEEFKNNLICAKYTALEGLYEIGRISEQKYKDYGQKEFNKMMGIGDEEPKDIYNFYAKNNLNKFEEWRENLKELLQKGRVGHGPNSQDRQSFLDRHFQKLVHFEVFESANAVTMWIGREDEIILYALDKIRIESPSKVRMVVTKDHVYLYVLMNSKRLIARYEFDTFEPGEIIQKDKKFNDTALYDPVDFEVLETEEEVRILVVDGMSSCIVLFNEELEYESSVCNKMGELEMVNIGSLSCVRSEALGQSFECFTIEQTMDIVIWFSVDVGSGAIRYLGNYVTGTQVDDLDPLMGGMVSLEALDYADKHERRTLLVVLRENHQHGAILATEKGASRLKFVTNIENIPGYNKLKAVRKGYNGPSGNNLMVIRESYGVSPIKKGNGIEEIMEMARDKSNIKWTMTWTSLESIIDVQDFSYKIPKTIGYLDKMELLPEFKNHERFKKEITFYIIGKEDEMEYINKTFRINKLTGEIEINAQEIKKKKIEMEVVSKILGAVKKEKYIVNFTCRDGEYYDDGCVQCPMGSYNSVKMERIDESEWSKCIKCPEKKTTRRLGSITVEECTCDKGYTIVIDEITKEERCTLCPPGTYKSVIGPEPCIGTCYKNSVSEVYGSSTEEGRQCACLPGYYWGDEEKGIRECVECEKGYFCEGGIKSKRNKCPDNTTSRQLSTKIEDCVCMMGYEPEEEHTREFESLIELQNKLGKSKIIKCIPCENNKYKDTESMDKCKECPPNSYSNKKGKRDVKECSKCKEGYYEINGNIEMCRKCRRNKYCPGSDIKDKTDKRESGRMMDCPANSITIKPYELNTSILNCLCVEGYVSVMNGFLLKCIPAPKDHYKDVVGNVEATPCPYGSLTMFNGATSKDSCVCDKGTYFDSQAQHCTVCPAGRYCLGGKDANNEDVQPMDCGDVNALTKAAGASSSSECACRAGYYMDVDSQDTCKECPENHYKSYVSNDQCTRCDDNSSTSGKKGATSKEQCVCDPGYYFDNACVSCSFKDKYCPGGVIETTDALGQTRIVTQSPVSCPPNTEIEPGVDNASSISFCKCTRGYSFVSENLAMNLKQCAPCVPGTYKSSVMDSSCNGLCTQNATSLHGAVSSNQCFCQPNYFYLEGGICSKCMEGARCAGGLINETEMRVDSNLVVDIDDHVKPVAIEGYYLDKINANLRKPDDWKFIRCPISGACLGEDRCSRSMEHYLCSECKRGYTNNFVKGALCQQCPRMVPNLSLTIVYYLVLLLVNIVMACLNISAGFNRRSIHSVVIKIALNFAICTSVINVINFGDLKLPEGLKRLTSSWIKVFDSEDIVYYTSLDCLLRQLFGLEHAQSFFYAMLYMAFLPIILLIIVTLLMLLILSLFKIRRYRDTRTKLALLQQAEVQGMDRIAEGLTEQYQNERLLMIFRYIPLPGQTRWVKFRNFLEDMIPIYVTVLFSVHGKITSRMLSLLDCTYIDLGRSFPGKYMLRPAMSVKCSLNPADGYLKYLVLGLGGLLVWGFGIPFLSFMVLYVNRKNLYDPGIRMKYGFLHNGFRQDYWYWETIVFTRKCLVLVIGSIVIVPSQNYSGSRIWMALVVAVTFLIIQLIYKPFDERDYFVLGRLENHSMIAWTFTLILFSFIIEANFSSLYNQLFLSFIVFINAIFILRISSYLFAFLYSDLSLKIYKSFNLNKFKYFKFSNFKFLTELKLSFDQQHSFIKIDKSHKRFHTLKNDKITSSDLDFLVASITNLYNVTLCTINIDIVPELFIEFLIRYSMSMANLENKALEKRLYKEYYEGNISKIVVDATKDDYQNLNKLVNIDKYREDPQTYVVLTDIESKLLLLGFEEKEINVIINSLFDDEFVSTELSVSDFFQSVAKLNNLDKRAISLLYKLFKLFKMDFERKENKEINRKIEHLTKIKNDFTKGMTKEYEDEVTREIGELYDEVNRLREIKYNLEKELREIEDVEENYKNDHENLLIDQKYFNHNEESENLFDQISESRVWNRTGRFEVMSEVQSKDFQ